MIPTYYDQIDARWLSEALSRRRPGTVVERAEPVGTRRGAGAKQFLRMTYRDGAGLPETLVMKGCFADIDPDSGRSAVILENLAVDGARFGAYEPLSPDAAAAVLGNLAELHSQFWGDRYSTARC